MRLSRRIWLIFIALFRKLCNVCTYRRLLGCLDDSVFVDEWENLGLQVIEFMSIDDFRQGDKGPWTAFQADEGAMSTFADKAAPDGVSRCTPTPLASSTGSSCSLQDLMPRVPPYFFHGGNIKVEYFKDGVKFDVAEDSLMGPAFFVTHNPFLAAAYGFKAIGHLHGRPPCSGGCECNNYRQVLQMSVEFPERCRGLVPDQSFLERMSQSEYSEKKDLLREECGEDCDFIAINWEGILPYEFRLLPGSIERCGIDIEAVLLIPFDFTSGHPMYGEDFFTFGGAIRKASKFHERLLALAKQAGGSVGKKLDIEIEPWYKPPMR